MRQIEEVVKRAAEQAGFDLCGVAPVRDFRELAYFPEWIANGHAGEMKYMEARDEVGNLKRASLSHTAPWARSVIVCAINYNTAQPYSAQVNDADRGWISRYAWSREDYHDAVLRRLKQIDVALQEAVCDGQSAPRGLSKLPLVAKPAKSGAPHFSTQRKLCPPELTTRCYVDTGPIVERVYAKYAGVGWIGKNTCIINQQKGSWLFLGVILTSLELEPDLPAPDRCGTCTRCIDACPTDAILAPYQLDSNKCISYLTIEKRGSIPEELRAAMGRHVFGCDICQDVCPWNRKAPATSAAEFQPRPGLVNPALEWLVQMSAEEFRETFRGSPIRRTKHSGLRRNVAVAMGNSGNRDFLTIVDQLAQDEDTSVAECALWARNRLNL
jgi:epoxyqueuosine reductase